jgi:hypothetical protein
MNGTKGQRSVRWIASLAIFLAMSGLVNGAFAGEGGGANPPSDPPDSTALSGGGFALDFKIWKHSRHGEPKALSVTYKWGSAGQRTARAQRQNARWHVEFPDQPEPNEQASLQLRYSFALSEEDKTTVRRAATQLEAAILSAINQASDKAAKPSTAAAPAEAAPATTPATDAELAPVASDPAFNAAFTDLARALATSSDAETLRSYGTSSGEDGLSFVLEQLGVHVGSGNVWTLDEQSAGRLIPVAKLHRRQGTSNPVAPLDLEGKKGTPEEQPCADAIPTGSPTVEAATTVLRKCAKALEGLAKTQKVDEAAASELVTATQSTPPVLYLVNQASNKMRDKTIRGSYSFTAVQAASESLRSLETQAAQGEHDAGLLKGIDQAFEQGSRVEDGATLIEGAAQPRRYDVATGIVFVGGIQDIVVPTLISICPSAGCLTANEVSWKGKRSWLRALSFDAGVRVKTLDTQDRRQSDKLSFLTGLSYNAASVLRLSGGFYWFENAQTKNWTGQPYVGVTLNVLNAAEILGSLGLGDQVAPSTNTVK